MTIKQRIEEESLIECFPKYTDFGVDPDSYMSGASFALELVAKKLEEINNAPIHQAGIEIVKLIKELKQIK